MLANIRTAWRWFLLLKYVADKFYIKTKISVLNENLNKYIYAWLIFQNLHVSDS
jgi:hypothetical protein